MSDKHFKTTTETTARKKARLEKTLHDNDQTGHAATIVESWTQGTNEGDNASANISAITTTTRTIMIAAGEISDLSNTAARSLPLQTFSVLPDEIVVDIIFGFVGFGHYRFVAGTNRQFRRLYSRYADQQRPSDDEYAVGVTSKVTSFESIVESVPRAKWCWLETRDDSGARTRAFSRFNCQIGGRIKHIMACIGTMAANYGNVQVLEWATQHGYKCTRWTCSYAAGNGQLEALKWARKHGCEWDFQTCSYAARNGHLKVLKWARKHGCEWNGQACLEAALNGHLVVLKWARQNRCNWNSTICSHAALNGHLEVLQWARRNGCNWDSTTCMAAARNGHLEVLQWARENGCNWSASTCSHAARNGHLHVLKWARQSGCNWDYRTCSYAAENGHLELLKWARENGCPES